MDKEELTSKDPRPTWRSEHRLAVVCTALVTTLLSWLVWSWSSQDPPAGPAVKKPLAAAPAVDSSAAPPARSFRQPATSWAPTSAPTPALLVGRDIMPGTYRTSGNDDCNWARLSGTGGAPFEIILGEEFAGDRTITIEPTDVAFYAVRCQALSRVAAPRPSVTTADESFPP